ncbi:hypothetical protein [Metabacillus niabensis]|nr:hypothetical protein [Metabacillus niabensis]
MKDKEESKIRGMSYIVVMKDKRESEKQGNVFHSGDERQRRAK